MKLTQLNRLALTYYAERSELNFQDLYAESSKLFLGVHIQMTLRTGVGHQHDAEESFNDALLELAKRDDIEDFGRMLSSALRMKRAMAHRTNTRRRKRYRMELDDGVKQEDGTYIPKHIAVEMETAEEKALSTMFRKKEADQRQLIDFLANDPSQVDHDTTLIVSQFEKYDSITALAKALGMHHESVKRKLRKLSRRYDANRFGDVADYLAV